MYDAFICYDDNDLEIAEEIVNLFEENNLKCWFKARDWNLISVKDIEYGISDCKILVLILSENTNNSRYVKNELPTAFSSEVPIITFKIDDCDIEDYFEFFISLKDSIDAYPNYKDGLEYLLKRSSMLAGKPLENLSKKHGSLFSKLKKSVKPKTPKHITLKKEDNNSFSHDVHIIYSTRDKFIADEVCLNLEKNGFKCWISPRDLVNDVYRDVAVSIKNSRIILFVFSKSSQNSRYAMREMEVAFNRQKTIISFVVDDTVPDIEGIYLMVDQWINAYPYPEDLFGLLNEEISKLIPGKSTLVAGKGRQPNPAYRGDGEFIFVSYAHKDADIVFPEISIFQNMGYNVWYDEGIGAGNEWLKDIVAHLKKCKIFIVFVTNNSMASINVQKEIKYSVKHNKNMIPIYLENYDDIEMEDDIDFELSVVPDIDKTKITQEDYLSKAVELFGKYGL